MPRKRSDHYVNNKELLEAMVVYRNKCAIAKEKGIDPPLISNYLGDCFLNEFADIFVFFTLKFGSAAFLFFLTVNISF